MSLNKEVDMALNKEADSFGVRYLTDVKSAGFQFQLEAYRVSSHTEEL